MNLLQPSFFYDNSEGNPAELLVDYFLSWTFRCAIDKQQYNISDAVQKSSKHILHFFLKEKLGDISIDSYKVIEVETLKQWKQIDLLCVVRLKINANDKWYVLTFENKMYTKLHSNQLEKYKNTIDEQYTNEGIEKLFFYLTNHMEVPSEDEGICNDKGFIAFPLWKVAEEGLREKFPNRIGNALFDEFWYNYI